VSTLYAGYDSGSISLLSVGDLNQIIHIWGSNVVDRWNTGYFPLCYFQVPHLSVQHTSLRGTPPPSDRVLIWPQMIVVLHLMYLVITIAVINFPSIRFSRIMYCPLFAVYCSRSSTTAHAMAFGSSSAISSLENNFEFQDVGAVSASETERSVHSRRARSLLRHSKG
jgi:hypothetical protein